MGTSNANQPVVDTNDAVAEARRWLVHTGVWQRHRTVFGWRYTARAELPSPGQPIPTGAPALRQSLLNALVIIAQVGSLDAAHVDTARDAGSAPLEAGLRAVLTATSDLIAWKAGRPLLPGGGGPQ